MPHDAAAKKAAPSKHGNEALGHVGHSSIRRNDTVKPDPRALVWGTAPSARTRGRSPIGKLALRGDVPSRGTPAMPSRRWAARCVMLLNPRTCLSTHHGLEGFLAGDEPILIAGGGLGGLTAALALARHGRPSRVLEGAAEFGAIGYGIQFGPNVFHVLDRIGVTDAVMAKADCPPAVLMRDAFTGDVLVTIPTGESFRARFKHPYIIIHRIDLHHALLDACQGVDEIELVSDARVTGFEDRGDGVAVTTADGR